MSKTEIKTPSPGNQMVPFKKFFKYASKTDCTLMILGTIGAVIAGAALPCMAILMGLITNSFNP